MIKADYLDRLYEEGFRFKLLSQSTWEADGDDFSCYAIYGSDGALLTSIILREYGEDGVAVYFCAETNRVDDDIARLKDIAAARAVEVKAHG